MDVYDRIRARTKPETREKVQKEMNKLVEISKIIDDSYKLYMPQVRYEIFELTKFLYEYWKDNEIFQPNVLEIGTKFGATLNIWNKLVDMRSADLNDLTVGNDTETPKRGMCISIDLKSGIHGGIDQESIDKRNLWFDERFDNCHFIEGNSHDQITLNQIGSFAQLNPPGGVFGNLGQLYKPFLDFLFIDGDHTYDGVKQDFYDYENFCQINSIIAFHDINDSQRHRDRNVFVSRFWNELIKDVDENNIISFKNKTFKVIEFNANEDWAGIGCLRRMS